MAELSTTISVFVERVVQPSCLTDVMELVRRLRIQAMMAPGYQLGAMWHDISNPNRILTLDTWQSRSVRRAFGWLLTVRRYFRISSRS